MANYSNSNGSTLIAGTLENDIVYSSGNYVTIKGNSGNDLISVSSGSRYAKIQYYYGDGSDTLYGLDSNDTLEI